MGTDGMEELATKQASVVEQSSDGGGNQPSEQQPRRARARLIFALPPLLIGAVVLAIWLYNETLLQKPLTRVIASQAQNNIVHALAHFDGWVDTKTVVFDLTDVSDQSSSLDIFRVFLQYAREQKKDRFGRIVLASYGQKKFILPGDYFQRLGQEFDSQNPMYTIRTFAHHLSDMNGQQPFPEYEGGLLAVLDKEMEQFAEFNKRWFLDDYVARRK
jgi:hypothetical protein